VAAPLPTLTRRSGHAKTRWPGDRDTRKGADLAIGYAGHQPALCVRTIVGWLPVRVLIAGSASYGVSW